MYLNPNAQYQHFRDEASLKLVTNLKQSRYNAQIFLIEGVADSHNGGGPTFLGLFYLHGTHDI